MAVAVSEVICLVNSILVHVGLPRKVSTLKQCNSSLFSQLYETLTGCRVPSLSLQAPTSEAVKCQAVIDALNVRLHPHVTLDHIQGTDIAQLDVISIKNLLDIFSVLFYVPLPTENGYGDVDSYSVDSCGDALVDDDGANVYVSDEANDSNVISSEGMSVISEVLREELGHSSRLTVTDSTTELVRPVPLARLPTRGNKTTKYATQVHSQQKEISSMGVQSTESSATTTTCNSQLPSLTISSLHSTSTEESRVISQVQDTPATVPNAGMSTAASARLHAQERAAETGGTNAKVGIVIPSGESSIGTTPSPTLHELHTPPQSPHQGHHRHQQLSPLHHSTPHTSTRSRLFPASTSTLTAISSNLPPHPLGAGGIAAAAVTPSVTTAHHQTRTQIGARSTTEGTTNNIQLSPADQSTLTLITTADGESTLVPDSPPSHPGPGSHSATHTRIRPTIPDLTITDLNTTTMSSTGGEGTAEQPLLDPHHRLIYVDAHGSSSEDSDSSSSSSTSRSSADTETPPPESRPSTVQPMRMPQAISSRSTTDNTCTCSAATVAQKVRFSHSVERREVKGARRGGRNLTTAAGQSGIEVGGDISSAQLKLGLDAHAAGSRASILATLYQNYLREVNTAQPVMKETPKVAASESKKTGRTTESKLKSYTRPKSKVGSSKYCKLESSSRKRSKPAAWAPGPKSPLLPQHKHTWERRASEGSSEESGSESEQQRPPTPTEFAVGDNMFPLIEREFPFIYVSPSTVRRLRQKQLQQVTALTRPKIGQKSGTVKKMAEVEQKQKALLQIIKKELDHTKRLQRQFEEQREKVAVKSSIRAKRQATARAKRYYHDYELQLKAKLQRRRTREEQIFKRTFEEGLELQRERIRELKRYAKERQQQHAKIHQDQLDSMENYYRDQLAMLSESMMKERKECAIRGKAQNQMVQKMKRELRQKIESEIRELQECLINEEDVAHFRELDAQNVRHKLSRMTFTTTVK